MWTISSEIDVYGDLGNDPSLRTPEALNGKCILSPKNVDVLEINGRIVDKLPGQVSGSDDDHLCNRFYQ